MHITPGVVDATKMVLAFGTASGAAAYTAKLAIDELKTANPVSFVARAAMATAGTFFCFQVLPHFVAGVSEVHFILATTLFLILGAGPAAIGLALGLLLQGLFFVPTDLPMYAVNVTTLLVPLFAMAAVGSKISAGRAYVDLSYGDVLKLSALYQGGVVSWVAFWVIYGQGLSMHTAQSILAFAGAYAVVLLVEPVADLAALAGAKALRGLETSGLVSKRLFAA